MKVMKNSSRVFVLFLLLFQYFSEIGSAGDWKDDFASLCGNTQNAENMTTEELSNVIKECDRVKEEVENSADLQKKVVLYRLKKSCDFYLFIKETRK